MLNLSIKEINNLKDLICDFCNENGYLFIPDYKGEFEYDRECIGIAFEFNLKKLKDELEFFCSVNKVTMLDLSKAEVADFMKGKILYFPDICFTQYSFVGKKDGMLYVQNMVTKEIRQMTDNEVNAILEKKYKVYNTKFFEFSKSKETAYPRYVINDLKGVKHTFSRAYRCFMIKDRLIEGIFIEGKVVEITDSNLVDLRETELSDLYVDFGSIDIIIDKNDGVWCKVEPEMYELKGLLSLKLSNTVLNNIPRKVHQSNLELILGDR